MTFNEKLKDYTDRINAELENAVRDFPKDNIVSEAMAYSLLAGGKRIRPVIALGVCDALGGNMEEALYFGCALEMIHTYSLIHDDLPCMDNDTLRRGMPTCHVKYGEAYALLAGDGLLTYAFCYITKKVKNVSRAFNFIKYLSYGAGIDGMVGGQTDDIKAETERASLSELMSIHARKTGALINCAGAAGAIAAGKDSSFCEDYTKSVGLAFQIKDDILDVEGEAEKMGKTLMKDIDSEKSTFVTILGIDKAKAELKRETDKAIKACCAFGTNGGFLKDLALLLLEREN
ncbi:MAG: polyprenyl synthetase family protein [Clostridia bacterium]|nr:polyprenyl synthetase family protein [Clostridia bacterium]